VCHEATQSNTAPSGIEQCPPGHTVYIAGDRYPAESADLIEGQDQRVFDLTVDSKPPGRHVSRTFGPAHVMQGFDGMLSGRDSQPAVRPRRAGDLIGFFCGEFIKRAGQTDAHDRSTGCCHKLTPCHFACHHYTNYINLTGRLPADKTHLLAQVRQALSREEATFRSFFIGKV